MAAELAVVIVSHNGGRFLEDCLASVERERGDKDWHVLVVDNASRDGSADLVAERFPRVQLVRLPENTGFASANNLGVRRSDARMVLFLNPDTRLLPGAPAVLIAEMAGHPRTGLVGPALLAGRGGYQVSFGGRVCFFREVVQKGLLNTYWRLRLKTFKKRKTVDWVSGACLLARRDVLERAAGFDEEFFLYFEDIDLCRRVRRMGFDVVFQPAARVFHAGGASAAGAPVRSRLEYRRSQLYYYAKHCGAWSRRLLEVFLRFTSGWSRAFGVRTREAGEYRAGLKALLDRRRGGDRSGRP